MLYWLNIFQNFYNLIDFLILFFFKQQQKIRRRSFSTIKLWLISFSFIYIYLEVHTFYKLWICVFKEMTQAYMSNWISSGMGMGTTTDNIKDTRQLKNSGVQPKIYPRQPIFWNRRLETRIFWLSRVQWK
jgi:hypothetical protein